jgi:hypothetical protein
VINNPVLFFQEGELSNTDYHKDFIAMLEVIKEYRGPVSMTHFPNILKQEIEAKGIDPTKAGSNKLKERKETVLEKFLSALMLSEANGAKYIDLKQSMKESFITGMGTYPESPEAVLWILNAFQLPDG